MKIVIPRTEGDPLEFEGVEVATVQTNPVPPRGWIVTINLYKVEDGGYVAHVHFHFMLDSEPDYHVGIGPRDSLGGILQYLNSFDPEKVVALFIDPREELELATFRAEYTAALYGLQEKVRIIRLELAEMEQECRERQMIAWAESPLGAKQTGKTVWAEPLMLGDREEQKADWREVLKEELDNLPTGRIVFNPPDTMKVGVKERIETRISKDLNANLISSLKGRGIRQTGELTISEFMKIRLTGDNFDIVALNEDEQIVGPTEFTEWAWDVTPNKSGTQVLHLHVTLRIRLPFGEERKDHPVLDKEIVVQVNRAYSIKSFIFAYWQWIVTALIVPPIAYLLKTYYFK